MIQRIAGIVLLLAGVGCGPSGEREAAADLVLLNGKIVTLDGDRQVEALAARDGKIVALGSTEDIRRLAGPATETIDLAGRLALPGFIEGHGHFTGLGTMSMQLDLREAGSWEDIVALVADRARTAAPGEWIVGRGWHQDKWSAAPTPNVEGYPVHDTLSAASPDNPVLLEHASGHAAMANAKALALAPIGRDTPDPAGGTILRGADGEATGLLRETAADLVEVALRRDREQNRETLTLQAIAHARDECLANGVTSFQDAGADFFTVDLVRRVAEAGELGVRLWMMLRVENDELEARVADYRMIGAADDHLTVRAIKRSIDGALGSHSAWLLEPYVDLPESAGLNTYGIEELRRTAEIALAHDLQLCVHAIGDRGNREVLDVFEATFETRTDGRDRRWRIEHAQHLHPDDIPRFAALGVIASMQAIHCSSDGPWVPSRLGDARCSAGAYVWRKLIDSGALVSNGTDVPVEKIDPLANFHAAVTRRMRDGRDFFPEQRMSRAEALRASTVNAAYAAFEDQQKGSLTPGRLADVVVLSRDILTIPEDEIPATEVLYTIVGGKVLYRRQS